VSSQKWYEECPDEVRKSECDEYETWWDRAVQTPKRLEHNRPDVVILDKKRKHWTGIIGFSVPSDRNFLKKEVQKVVHYTPLSYEVTKFHKVSTEIIVPLVVVSLGLMTKNLEKDLKSLNIPDILGSMQIYTVLGTAIMLYGKF